MEILVHRRTKGRKIVEKRDGMFYEVDGIKYNKKFFSLNLLKEIYK